MKSKLTIALIFLFMAGFVFGQEGEGTRRGLSSIDFSAYFRLDGSLAMTGNLLLGANGIGNNAGVLSFGIGADGTATFGGNIDISGKNLIGDGDTYLDFGTADTYKLYIGNVLAWQIAEAAGAISTTLYGDLDMQGGKIYGNRALDYLDTGQNNSFKFFMGGTECMRVVSNYTQFGSSGGNSPHVRAEAATATNPVFCPIGDDDDTGDGWVSANIPTTIAGGIETQRNQAGVDTDSDTDDVLSTALTGVHGYLIVAEGTADESCMYFLTNVSIEKMSSDATFTVTKDNGSTYNVYYDTTAFMIQNKVGDNKSLKWVFYGIPVF